MGLSSGLLLAQAWAQPADNGPAPLAGIDSTRPDFGAQQYSATSQYQQTGSEPDEAAGLFGASANSTQQPNDTEHADTTTVNDPATTTADTATDNNTARQETPRTPATQSTPTQQQSEPDASSNEAASHTEQPEETPSLQQTHASKNPIFFSGRAPGGLTSPSWMTLEPKWDESKLEQTATGGCQLVIRTATAGAHT